MCLPSRFGPGPTVLRTSLSTELFPLGYDNRMEIPLPSTSSPETGVPSAEATNLKVWGMIISGDIINSWIDLNSDLRAGNIKRQILLIPRMFCGSARNETQSKEYQNKLHWVNTVSSELSLAAQLLSLKADEARQVQSPFLLFSIVQSKQGTEMLSPFAQRG